VYYYVYNGGPVSSLLVTQLAGKLVAIIDQILIYFLVRKDLEIPTTPPKPSKNTIEISIPKRPDSKMYLSAIWNLVHE